MSERFFSDEPLQSGATTVLAGTEAHHALHVMRLAVGDEVTLFDGSGDEYLATVQATSRRDLTLEVGQQSAIDREAEVSISMGIALPKGDRQKVLIEKLTEVGVQRVLPLVTKRSVAAPKVNGLEKLRRLVIESSKQCRRNRLMQIDDPLSWDDFLKIDLPEKRLIAHPTDERFDWSANAKDSCAVAIGPEGGFSEEEYAKAVELGWQGVSLGKRILRIETAAIGLAFRLIHN